VASAAAAVCGNGIAETPEECDDGNASNADACLATCQRPVTWVTSDVHVHTTGCSQDVSPARLAEELKKQQIQVGAALVWGEGYATDAPLFTGRDHPLSSAGFILHYDMEVSHFQAARGGHLLLLGLDSIAFSSDVFPHAELGHSGRRVGAPPAAGSRGNGSRPVLASGGDPGPAGRLLHALGHDRARRARTARLPVDGAHARGGSGLLPVVEGDRERGLPRTDHGRQRLVVHRRPLPRAHARAPT
jgi:cysteine-rich repeat protein